MDSDRQAGVVNGSNRRLDVFELDRVVINAEGVMPSYDVHHEV